MHALIDWLRSSLAFPWLVALSGWCAALVLWYYRRNLAPPTEIVVRDGPDGRERLIEVYPPRGGKVQLYYDSPHTGRILLRDASHAQSDALSTLAGRSDDSPQDIAQRRAVTDDIAHDAIPLPPDWPRPTSDARSASGIERDGLPAAGSATASDDATPPGFVLRVDAAPGLTVTRAPRHAAAPSTTRPTRVPVPVQEGLRAEARTARLRLWRNALLAAAGITLTAFLALWWLLPNRTPADLLWFVVPALGAGVVGWVVAQGVRGRD